MNIVLPIIFGAVCVGLFSARITQKTVWGMALWITCVVLWYYIRN